MIIHSILHSSRVNGPGERMVVWVQGCRLACPGCWNPETHPFAGGTKYQPAELAKKILESGTNALTWSGGEPMHHAQGVASTMMLVSSQRPGFSWGMYTGYTEKELESGSFFCPESVYSPDRGEYKSYEKAALWRAIKGFRLDFAVMGRYNEQLKCELPLRSSTNQVLKLFTSRYIEQDFAPQEVEFHCDADLIQITGFPTENEYANA